MSIEPLVRTISGRGVIQIPEEYQKCSAVYLYTQLLRPPTSEYLNTTTNPNEAFYANVCFCQGDYVVRKSAIKYESQRLDVHSSQPSQNLLSLICAYECIRLSLREILGEDCVCVPCLDTNQISIHSYITFDSDIIRFRCYADTALRLTLRGVLLDRCEESDGTPQPPPDPPPPITKAPPGQPVTVSPPYDFENPDNPDTDPYEGDVLPEGEGECRIIFDYRSLNSVDADQELFDQASQYFRVVLPAEIIDVVYSDADAIPAGTFRSSDAIVRGADGNEQTVPLQRNGVSGHLVSNLRFDCIL